MSSARTCVPPASSVATIARPIPPAAPVTTAVSGNKNDLAGRLPRRDQVERLVRLVERILGADDRVQRSAPPEREQLLDLAPDQVAPEPHQPAQVEALDADVAADEARRI